LIVEQVDGSPDRASGDADRCSHAQRRASADPHPSRKTRMAPCRISIPLPFPTSHTGSCFVVRPAMRRPGFGRWEQRKRHEKTPLTPLTLREADCFVIRCEPADDAGAEGRCGRVRASTLPRTRPGQ
jgi:hypothetical protein